MKKTMFLIFVTVFASIACKKQSDPLRPAAKSNNPLISGLDKQVDQAYSIYGKDLNTVGVSIGIYKNGSVNYYGYGETRQGNAVVPTRDTYFEIGSITKTFTSIAAMNMLNENGQTIEEPIRTYLPSKLPTLARDGVEVNVKHLMTHTSGLSYFPDNFGVGYYFNNLAKEFEKYDRNKLFTWLLNTPLRHKPFTTWEYSNGGMGLLGTILESNYKKDYSAIIKEKLLSPLQLNETTALMAETDLNRWATGYSKGKEAEYWKSLNALDGAGVLKSTTADLVKYGLANMNPPNTPLGNAIRQTQQITFLPFTSGGDYFKINGRLGWFQFIHNKLPNESFIWHNGGTGGFSSDLFINKAKGSILVILYNSDEGTTAREDFRFELLKIISE